MDPMLEELYSNRDFHRRLAARFRHSPLIRDAQQKHVEAIQKKIDERVQANLQARLNK